MDASTNALPGMILATLRTLIVFGGGFLVAKGYLTADQLAQAGGVVATIVTLGFAIYSQFKHKQDLKAAQLGH